MSDDEEDLASDGKFDDEEAEAEADDDADADDDDDEEEFERKSLSLSLTESQSDMPSNDRVSMRSMFLLETRPLRVLVASDRVASELFMKLTITSTHVQTSAVVSIS